jgi:serine/threonine-protein kinase HipA
MTQARFQLSGDLASVTLWGKPLGVVKANASGVVFQFDDTWVDSRVEVSPLKMPLIKGERYQFNELLRIDSFQGLPGMLADALPDQFGNKLAEAFFAKQGKTISNLSPVQKLLYMGNRAMGALEFEPAFKEAVAKDTTAVLEVRALVEQSRRLIEGPVDSAIKETLAELMRVGGSAGGARPKAVVLWDTQKHTIRSGFARPHKNEKAWLIKFDGTGTLEHPNPNPTPYNRIEYVYSLMAKRAGVEMAETALYEDGPYAHFMTERFDREGAHKHHIHSLGGLMHVDFNTPQAVDYLDVMSVCKRLGLNQGRMEQMYRRIAFNLIAVNQDDHVKNFAFRMKEGEDWDLSPAYDISFVKGQGWTKRHQIRLMGRTEESDFSNAVLLDLGHRFGLNNAQAVLDEVASAVSEWPALAKEQDVPQQYIAAISNEHRLFLGSGKHQKQTLSKSSEVQTSPGSAGYKRKIR